MAGMFVAWLFSRVPLDGQLGRPAPVFALPRLAAEGQVGSAELRGKRVVVAFWASWCEPCAEESRLLEAAWREHRSDGVVVLGVNVQDTRDEAMAFLRRRNVTYPSVVDTGVVAGSFGVTGLPETYFLDARWRMVGMHRGDELGVDPRHGWAIRDSIDPPTLERRIQALIATRMGDGPPLPTEEG